MHYLCQVNYPDNVSVLGVTIIAHITSQLNTCTPFFAARAVLRETTPFA